jgi:ubiquinone biosynthesis protein UbiJ
VLTDADKQWITSVLGERLEKVETSLRSEFSERLEKVEIRFAERLEKVETTLLTEFHKWASPTELRLKSHAAAIRALDTEVDSLSDRLKNLEGH